MRPETAITTFVFALLLIGCTSSPKPATTSTTATKSDPSCPVEVAGTSVSVEDAASGAALVFITTGDVADVRKRVAMMGQMHNDHHSKMGALPTGTETTGGGHAGHDMSGMDHSKMDHSGHAAGGMISVHSAAKTEEIEGGARLVFTSAPADVAKLQGELRKHAEHLARGTCAMGH